MLSFSSACPFSELRLTGPTSKPATDCFLDVWGRSEVRVRGSLCHGGRGEKEDAPLYSTWGQIVPEKPPKFLHCIVSDILGAAEWELQTT